MLQIMNIILKVWLNLLFTTSEANFSLKLLKFIIILDDLELD